MQPIVYIDPKIIARETAKIFLETQSVLFNADEPFTYTSGNKAPIYTDGRRLLSFPRARAAVMDFAASTLIRDIGYDSIDMLAGGETAGIPYAAMLAERLSLPMVYVRKKPKGFGRMAQIEGVLEEDSHVVLIEDLQTDGGSKRFFIEPLRTAGAVVKHALVIFHYGFWPKSEQNMKDLNITLHALTTMYDVLDVARETGYADPETIREIEKFMDNPEQWSLANGGIPAGGEAA